jgi:hypothetical protein
MSPPFEKGDLVWRKDSRNKQNRPIYSVVHPDPYNCTTWVRVKNLQSGKTTESETNRLEPYNPFASAQMETIRPLFKFTKPDGTEAYGHQVGTNSQMEYLLEVKGDPQYYALSPDKIEEVLPFSFQVKLGSGVEEHFVAKEGQISKGDLLMFTGGASPAIVVVSAVDTKHRGAKKFQGSKLITEPLG